MMLLLLMVIVMIVILKIIIIIIIIIIISNGNRIDWSTIQGLIGQVILNQPSMDKRKAVLKLGFLFPIQAAPQFL